MNRALDHLCAHIGETTLACNWDGVCVHSDRACWEFSQKFHAVTENNIFLRLWVSDPVQSPVTKCPHLYLNCRRACFFLRLWVSDPVQSPVTKCPHLYLNRRRAWAKLGQENLLRMVRWWHRIQNSSPGGLKPSTLPLGHGGFPQYWLSHVDGEETFFVSFKPPRPGTEPRNLAWKAAVLTNTLGPPPILSEKNDIFEYALERYMYIQKITYLKLCLSTATHNFKWV